MLECSKKAIAKRCICQLRVIPIDDVATTMQKKKKSALSRPKSMLFIVRHQIHPINTNYMSNGGFQNRKNNKTGENTTYAKELCHEHMSVRIYFLLVFFVLFWFSAVLRENKRERIGQTIYKNNS